MLDLILFFIVCFVIFIFFLPFIALLVVALISLFQQQHKKVEICLTQLIDKQNKENFQEDSEGDGLLLFDDPMFPPKEDD